MLLNRTRAEQLMKQAGVDILIATNADNVAYMSDYVCRSHRITSGVQVYGLVPADNSAPLGLVIPSLEVDAWAEHPGDVADITVYGTVYRERAAGVSLTPDDQRIYDYTVAHETQTDAVAALVETLKRRGMTGATLGLDESNLTAPQYSRIVQALPQARIVPSASLWQNIRLIKTEEEIRRMARSSEITEQAMREVYAALREGVTERELVNCFNASVAAQGAQPAFAILSAGRRTGHTHAIESDYALRPGDLLKLDMGCIYQFYWSDVGRTKALGKPDARAQHIYEILCKGLQATIAKVRPGARAAELFDTAVNTIRELGIPNYQRHHCGHGIGIQVYDPPLIQPRGYRDIFGMDGSDPILEEGMVVNLEAPYYSLGEFGFIVEDTMVVRANGPELFTHLDYSLSAA